MASYTITIKNESGESQDYLLFMKQPKTTGLDSKDVFTNVYITSPGVQSGPKHEGHCKFTLHKDFYAVTGTSPSPLDQDVQIETGTSASVTLAAPGVPGSQVFMSAPNDSPFWDDTRASTTTAASAFAIKTDDSFQIGNKNNIYIGMGGKDPNDSTNILPVATFVAHPSATCLVWPHVIYYISTGSYQAGTIIDVATLGNILEVNFTGAVKTDVVYVHNANGDYVLQ